MLSGLHGFDFVIDERSGATKLIEINPRATQISHFNLGPGRDLAACEFRRNPARDSDLMSATVPI
jgi:predicted ATP-grasp superfamily ATP-dependent carboligase